MRMNLKASIQGLKFSEWITSQIQEENLTELKDKPWLNIAISQVEFHRYNRQMALGLQEI